MYDSLDGLKAGILKDVDTSYAANIIHKGNMPKKPMKHYCAICEKEITIDIIFCNGDNERICQECWDNG